MKFDSVQKIWSHCSFCPLCQDCCRKIKVNIFSQWPSPSFNTISYKKDNQFLIINCVEYNSKMKIQFIINCIDNTFKVISTLNLLEYNTVLEIDSDCNECFSTRSTTNLKIDYNNTIISNSDTIDYININNSKNDVSITIFYYDNYIIINDSGKDDGIKLPMMNLDFKNIKNVIQKLKTLILFS